MLALPAQSDTSLRDVHLSITYLLGHLDFMSLSHRGWLHSKYHSVMGSTSKASQENTNHMSTQSLVQKPDYTGEGRAKKQNRRH